MIGVKHHLDPVGYYKGLYHGAKKIIDDNPKVAGAAMGGLGAFAASFMVPGGEGGAAEMAAEGSIVLEDVYAFGAPRLPRPVDFQIPHPDVIIPSQAAVEWPKGASTTKAPMESPLSGPYHRLPKGTRLPEGMKIISDGKDVVNKNGVKGSHAPGHYTLYNTNDIHFTDFQKLFEDLPWVKAGNKPKRR